MLEKLNSLDTQLFLYLNNKHCTFLDVIMYWMSDKVFWIPFYVIMLLLITWYLKKKSIPILVCIAVLITLSDQISANFIKDLVKRPRPSHALALQGLVHLSKAGPGGQYGFVSSHASNCFALFCFLSLVLPKSFRNLKYILCFWAIIISYSRIYNGVHYPGDVMGGALLGALLAWLISLVYFWFISRSRSYKL
jgi:undecaprenyl-diphosphatase